MLFVEIISVLGSFDVLYNYCIHQVRHCELFVVITLWGEFGGGVLNCLLFSMVGDKLW